MCLCVFGTGVGLAGCGDKESAAAPGAGSSSGAGGSGGAVTTGGGPGGGTAGSGGAGGIGGLTSAPTCPPTTTACTPTLLAAGLPTPGTLVVWDGYLYWRNSEDYAAAGFRDPNAVLRLRLPDGTPEVLATLATGRLASVAVDASSVYFGDSQGGVGRVAHAGGPVEYLETTLPALVVALDDTHVYFSSQTSGAVARVPKAGGEAQALATATSPVHIGLDATHLYWVDGPREPFTLARVPKAGGAAEVLASDVPAQPERVILLDDGVYLPIDRTLAVAVAGEPRGRILRYPKTGGAAVELASHPAPFGAMGVDAEYFYVSTCPGVAGEAELLRVPHAGGAPVAIARGGTCYVGVTTDATHAYFTEWSAAEFEPTGEGQVRAAPKCGCP